MTLVKSARREKFGVFFSFVSFCAPLDVVVDTERCRRVACIIRRRRSEKGADRFLFVFLKEKRRNLGRRVGDSTAADGVAGRKKSRPENVSPWLSSLFLSPRSSFVCLFVCFFLRARGRGEFGIVSLREAKPNSKIENKKTKKTN